jgi:hypothetical protein
VIKINQGEKMTEYKKQTEYVLRSRIDPKTKRISHDIPMEAGVWIGDVLQSYRTFAETALNPNRDTLVGIKSIEVRVEGETDLSD